MAPTQGTQIAGVIWSDEEWKAAALAWAQDELEHEESSGQSRWTRIMSRIPAERRRPYPKSVRGLGKLNELLPEARQEAHDHQEPKADDEAGDDQPARSRVKWRANEVKGYANLYAMYELAEPSITQAERCILVQHELVKMGKLDKSRMRLTHSSALMRSPTMQDALARARADAKEAEQAAMVQAELKKLQDKEASEAAKAEADAKAKANLIVQPKPQDVQPIIQDVATALAQLTSADLIKLWLGTFIAEVVTQPHVMAAIKQAFNGTPAAAPSPSSAALQVSAAPSMSVPIPRHNPLPAGVVPHQRKRKVLIVGLLGSQKNTIEFEYGDKLDLRFLTQDDSHTRMRELASSCEVTFGMVGYMNHSAEKHLKNSRDFRRCNGTVSELRRMLDMLLREDKQAA